MAQRTYHKEAFPVSDVRSLLEPGPIVLVSSHWKGKSNIMTMGWYTVMEFTPSLIGCVIASTNYSHQLVLKSKECVLNIPTASMAKKVAGIGTHSGAVLDKFATFKLTEQPSQELTAPGIKECYANLECKLVDARQVKKYDFFIMEVVAAQKAISPRWPETMHYRGHGLFMLSGASMNMPELKKL